MDDSFFIDNSYADSFLIGKESIGTQKALFT